MLHFQLDFAMHTLIRGFKFYLLSSPLHPTPIEVNTILLLHWLLMKHSPFWHSSQVYLLKFKVETAPLGSTLTKGCFCLPGFLA